MEIISIVFIVVCGCLLHFIYEWSGHNKYVALIAAVNESTWEHIKMALTPMFVWSFIDGYIYGSSYNYFLAKFFSLVVVIIMIIVLFSITTAITKVPNLILDIVDFIIAIILAQVIFYQVINAPEVSYLSEYAGTIGVFMTFAVYMSMTMLPLEGALFMDPVTEKYGVEGHPEEDEVEAWEKAEREKLEKETKKRRRRRRKSKKTI